MLVLGGRGVGLALLLLGLWRWRGRRPGRPRGRLIGGLGLGLLLGGPALGQRGIAPLLRAPPAPTQRFAQAMGIGGLVGRLGGLGAVARLAPALPPELRHTVLDGAAHGLRTGAHSPAEVARLAHDHHLDDALPALQAATMRERARTCGLAPACTQAALTPWGAEAAGSDGQHAAQDAVRTVMQDESRDLAATRALAASYPPAWQPALFEELGWRAGHDGDPEALSLAARLPAPASCAWARGVARGEEMRPRSRQGPAGAGPLAAALARQGHGAAVRSGRAWGLLLATGSADAARALARPDEALVAEISALAPTMRGPATPWTAPDGRDAPCPPLSPAGAPPPSTDRGPADPGTAAAHR